MTRFLPLACLAFGICTSPAAAEAPATPAREATVEEILRHLETFMPAPGLETTALYVLGPPERPSSEGDTSAPLPGGDADASEVIEEDAIASVIDTETPVQPEAPAPADEIDEAASETMPDALEERLGAIDFDSLSRDVQIVPRIGKDMAAIDQGFRAAALHDMARQAIDRGQPAAFRKIMAAYVDPHWQALNDAETALNIIAWMPDTAAFLGARISAARFVGGKEALSPEDQAYLWKDLRARVVRVGSDDYMHAMLSGMIETGHVDLAIETIKKTKASDHERMASYLELIEADGARMDPDALSQLATQVDALRADGQATRYDPNAVALAYWRSGLTSEALEALDKETDPALRLRTHFEMLLDTDQ